MATIADASPKSDALRDDLRTTVQALSAAVQALTQATQVLHATTNMMVQTMPPPAGMGAARAGAAASTINVWEDDPFSEATPSANPAPQATMAEAAPAAVTHGLRWQIAEPRFDAAPHAPGSTEFRFWNAEAALTRCAGFWAPPMPQLVKIREHIAATYPEIDRIARAKSFTGVLGSLDGERMTRVPRGFPKYHPAADYLRFRQFLGGREFPPEFATTREFYPALIETYKALMPLIRFLNAPLTERLR